MYPYVLSPDALQDLQDIWDFIAEDNMPAANKLEDEFFDAFERLASLPKMGHTRRDLTSRDVRFWPVGSYLIVYRARPKSVEVVAVLRGSRDIPTIIRQRQI